MTWGNNKIIKVAVAVLVLSSFFLLVFNINTVEAQFGTLSPKALSDSASGIKTSNPVPQVSFVWSIIAKALGFIGSVIQRFAAIILALVGMWFEWVLKITVAEMSTSLGKNGIGGSISEAWGTIRDIANLTFIFVLLYAAVKVIFFDLNTKSIGGTIKNIVIVGLLINFSMFFTKVVIDAANIPAIGFYNAIIAGAGTKTIPVIGNTGAQINPGITTVFMKAAGVQSFLSTDILGFFKNEAEADGLIFINAIFSAVAMIVMAIVFLITSVMFVARYILLIFLMVLSPLALIAYILPGTQNRFWEWVNSLKSQAFFAPLFMLILWVAIKVMASTSFASDGMKWSTIGARPQDALGLMLNYSLVIGFIIFALIASKKMAGEATGFNTVAGGVGTAVLGGAGLAGRQTIGRAAGRLEKSQVFQRWAGRSKIGNVLYTGTQKTARASFDTRRLGETAIGKMTGAEKLVGGFGKAGGEGGYEKTREEKTKRMIEKGKQFTDRQARVNYARRIASKLTVIRGSTPNNVNSLFGTMGRSHRMAAATLLDERIKELRADMNAARGELNTLNNNMGFTPAPGITPNPAQLGMLSLAEQARYAILTGPAATNGSIANMSAEMQSLSDPATGLRHTLGLDSTLRQQY